MKVERNSPVRSTRSVAQAAYARRMENAGGATVDTVAPSAVCWGFRKMNSPPKCATPSWG